VTAPTVYLGMTAKLPVTTASSNKPPKPSGHLQNAQAPERVPVKLDRNFLNFPLARDKRTKAHWFQGSKTGRWMADLPGEGRDTHRIRLILPADAPPHTRRCPTALDMNVLFQLLAEAQREPQPAEIEFASFAVLLRRLGLDDDRNRERRRLEASLLYWTRVSIKWSRWYQNREYVPLMLPPPIRDIERDRNRLMITLDDRWQRLARGPGCLGAFATAATSGGAKPHPADPYKGISRRRLQPQPVGPVG
jgi:hypothetical protein